MNQPLQEDYRILGIDPGSRVTGYGVVQKENNNVRYVACGVIRPTTNLQLHEKLLEIYSGICGVIAQFNPQVMAIENVFVSINPMSALKLGHARGVIMLAAMQNQMQVHEYSAKAVKQAVAGYGQAAKSQVQHMVRILLKLSANPSQDAADALAVALCYANHSQTPFALNSP